MILVLVAFVWAGDATVSLLVQHGRLRTKLSARLEAAFGRPVEVGGFGFSLWSGPVLEAHSVRIGEDPRFGNEYFIRANSISVGLRWWSLLRGHIALGTLSVDGASLNLVRSADGDWNLAEWLPRPQVGQVPSGPAGKLIASSSGLQFHRIEIHDSRIDFKRGEEKLAFALVDVNGSMDTDAPGRWRVNITAAPWRVATLTQQPGSIRVTGHIGGTSSRLRPAALDISWTGVSISDLFRLARGDDYGIRGDAAMSISAQTVATQGMNGWVLQGAARISGLHRWDMAARPDNPSLNLIVDRAFLDPELSELRIPSLRLEAPRSRAQASISFNWTDEPSVRQPRIAASNFVDLLSSQVDLGDVLAWVRAFHPGVPDSTVLRGTVDVRASLTGWPPRVSSVSARGGHAEMISTALRGPVRVAPLDFRYNRGALSFDPVTVTWGNTSSRPGGSFRIDSSKQRRSALFPAWHIAGSAEDVRGITALAGALGLNLLHGWDLQGPLSCDLRWQPTQFPWDSAPTGVILLGTGPEKSGGAVLRAPFLNLPVEQVRARAQLKPGAIQIALASAKAFGANWSGTFERKMAGAGWQFAVSADRITAADLDRWLNPRWRESFLGRMLPFFASSESSASPEDLHATGDLNLGEFALGPLALRHIAGNLSLTGRTIELSNAQGQFYGGQLSGLLRADLSGTPSYHAEIKASHVDASALAAATHALAGVSAQALGGEISIDAHGASRGALISSLGCRGKALSSSVEIRGLDLTNVLAASSQSVEDPRIAAASANFTCAQRAIHFQKLLLDLDGGTSLTGTGTIGFDRSLDLRFHERPADALPSPDFHLTGNIASPQFTRLPSVRGAH